MRRLIRRDQLKLQPGIQTYVRIQHNQNSFGVTVHRCNCPFCLGIWTGQSNDLMYFIHVLPSNLRGGGGEKVRSFIWKKQIEQENSPLLHILCSAALGIPPPSLADSLSKVKMGEIITLFQLNRLRQSFGEWDILFFYDIGEQSRNQRSSYSITSTWHSQAGIPAFGDSLQLCIASLDDISTAFWKSTTIYTSEGG